MNAGKMEKLAKMAANEAVSETFLTLGMDISNPISVQGQFAFLRDLHYAARHARNVIIAGVLGGACQRRRLCVLDWLQGQCRSEACYVFPGTTLTVCALTLRNG